MSASTPAETVGERIRSFRTGRGMTQQGLAHLCHTSQMTVSRWERGEVAPGPARRVMIAEALDAPANVIFRELLMAEATA